MSKYYITYKATQEVEGYHSNKESFTTGGFAIESDSEPSEDEAKQSVRDNRIKIIEVESVTVNKI